MSANALKLNRGLFRAVDKRRSAAFSPTIIILVVIVSLILASGFG
jgi:hypothetical protein